MSTVRYAIKGTNDSAAIDQAKQGLLGLGDGVNKLNGLFKAFVGLKVIQGLGKAAGDTMAAFSVQQNAVAQLTNSIKNNANLSADSLKRLTSYASGLQKKGIYGDEELLKQASYLASLGLTEDKIKGVMEASANLAAAGVMPLDAAVKNMAKQFGGMAGELGESIPALRTLTAEQLKAGEGIALVQKQYAGALETAASTLSGKTKQVENLVGDMKEKVGAVFGELKVGALTAIQPFLEKFDAWLDVASKKIVNVIKNLPEVMTILGEMISGIFKNALNVDYLFLVFAELGKFVWEQMKNAFTNIGPLIVELFKEIINNILYIHYRLNKIIDWIGAKLSDVFMGVAEGFVNSILRGINAAIESINKMPGIKIGLIDNVKFDTNKAAGVAGTTGNYQEWKASSWGGALKANPDANVKDSMAAFARESMANLSTALRAMGSPLIEGLQPQLDALNEVLDRQVEATTNLATAATGESSSSGGVVAPVAEEAKGPLSLLGDMNPFSLIMDSLKGFAPLVEVFGKLSPLINWMSTIFSGIMDVLGPIIDSLLKPLIGILKIVGQTIGKMLAPALQLLEPIITAISKLFVWLFNKVVVPIYNAIQGVFNLILNGFVAFANGILAIIDAIPFVDVGRISYRASDAGFLDTISLDDVSAAGGTTNPGAASPSSYTGAKDVIVNIYYSNSYVNGDAREIALNIRNEIKLAEGVGL